ncbi:MAG TPA: LCP family protein [Candidatus Woesebacteria bacterium]|nr:LCP family protein [Candidatus Woesebacteria bacterium]HUM57535.1 LCP family protein [Candidatus Woesebacteria bacterium]
MFKKVRQTLTKKLRKFTKKQKTVLYVLLCLLILIISISATVAYQHFQQQKQTQDEILIEAQATHPLNSDTSQIEENDRKELNVLLIGYGGAGHQGGMLADLIQIAHFDFEKNTLAFISIPRDLELSLGNGRYQKINNVFSSQMTGSDPIVNAGQVTKNLLSSITNLNIKYFIAVDFVGFQRLIGQELGSIEVEVAEDFKDQWYPIEGKQLDPCGYSNEEIAQLTATLSGFELEKQFTCRYETIYFPAGLQKMEGAEALKYVRSRHSSSDFDRSRRQVEVLTGIRKKLFELEALSHIPDFFKKVNQHVTTDLNLEILEYLAPLLLNANDFTIKNINLSTENVLNSSSSSNGFVLIPKAGPNNWTQLQNFIQDSLNSDN